MLEVPYISSEYIIHELRRWCKLWHFKSIHVISGISGRLDMIRSQADSWTYVMSNKYLSIPMAISQGPLTESLLQAQAQFAPSYICTRTQLVGGISPPFIFSWVNVEHDTVMVQCPSCCSSWMDEFFEIAIWRWFLQLYRYIATNNKATKFCSLQLQVSHRELDLTRRTSESNIMVPLDRQNIHYHCEIFWTINLPQSSNGFLIFDVLAYKQPMWIYQKLRPYCLTFPKVTNESWLSIRKRVISSNSLQGKYE